MLCMYTVHVQYIVYNAYDTQYACIAHSEHVQLSTLRACVVPPAPLSLYALLHVHDVYIMCARVQNSCRAELGKKASTQASFVEYMYMANNYVHVHVHAYCICVQCICK